MTTFAKSGLLASSALLLLTSPALAQTGTQLEDPFDAVVTPADDDGSLNLDEVIVTGVAAGSEVTQFESTVSISTFDEETLAELAPLTLSDAFAQVPGVWAETSGGGAASNVFIRGIPAPGQFLFSKINVDGLPVFEEHGIGFLTPDGMYRNDLMTSRLEAVRGGSSSVYASNAPGGIFNYITKRGTLDPEGAVQFEYGDFGHYRFDGYYAGPITDDTLFSVGGFYRVADGVRDPGFRGDEGGQISGNITHIFDRGEVTVSGRYVNDKNLFLLAIPLDLDGDDDLDDFPGIDANTGTLVSNEIRNTTLLFPGGPEEFDLADGINNVYRSVGAEFEYDLGDGFELVNLSRYIDGETQFNTSIPFSFASADEVLAGQLGRAQAAFGDEVASVQARFVGSGNLFQPDENGNGFIGVAGFFPVNTDFDNFINDLSVSKGFDTGLGRHDVTASFYTSFYSLSQFQTFGTFFQEIATQPRNLDIVALDEDGQIVGSVTQNGFDAYSSGFYQNYSGDGAVYALTLSDSWEVNDRLRVDGGVRYESNTLEGAVETQATFDLSAQNTLGGRFVDGDGNVVPTLADDAVVFGSGNFEPFRQTYTEWAYTVGGNYVITDQIAAFARISDGNRTPTLDDLAAAGAENVDNIPVGQLLQLEGGAKFDVPFVQAFVTGFYSDVDNQPFTEPVNDVNGSPIDATIVQSSRTYGVEVEADVGPFELGTFASAGLNVRGTFQDPEITGLSVSGGGLQIDDAFIDGNQVPRIPKRIIAVQPRIDFNTLDWGLGFGGPDGVDGALFANIYSVGDRFQNFQSTVELPGYTTIGIGGRFDFAEGYHLGFNWDNLTNEIGLTEGNVRGDLFRADQEVNTATFGRPIVGRNFRVNFGYRF